MKIISWNVNGIRACAKKGFFEFIDDHNPDVLCLQETKAHPDQVEPQLINPSGRVSYWTSAFRKGYSGTATYLKSAADQVEHGIGVRKFDSEGRFVITRVNDIKIYNVYFPNGSSGPERHDFKQEFLACFSEHLDRELKAGEQVIVLGDYNVAHQDIDVFDPVRLATTSGFLPEERTWFSEFLRIGFIDTFRYFYPDKAKSFTWWSYKENGRAGNRGWRIDHICVSKNLAARLKSAAILQEQMGSDHCPIVLNLHD